MNKKKGAETRTKEETQPITTMQSLGFAVLKKIIMKVSFHTKTESYKNIKSPVVKTPNCSISVCRNIVLMNCQVTATQQCYWGTGVHLSGQLGQFPQFPGTVTGKSTMRTVYSEKAYKTNYHP